VSAPEGTIIGNYRIARPIGTGGFSTVYLAHDDRLDTEVAIKVLAENRALDLDARRRFVEEAQKLRKVKSPDVVSVYDVGETDQQQPYMVLEYAERGDLAHRHRELAQPVSFAGCLRVVDFLHAALSALHHVSLVHRDVKPQNILIRTSHGAPELDTPLLAGNERPLLGDLGFVKDLELASGLTVGGGTWAYQAPEQRQRLGTIDARADIFSATAVIAWLLTGQYPPDGQLWTSLIKQIPSMGTPVRDQLLKGLADSPDERHQTMERWHAEMTAAIYAASPDISSSPLTVQSPPDPGRGSATQGMKSTLTAPTSKLKRLGAVVAALALGLAGLAAGYGIWNDSNATGAVETEQRDLENGSVEVTATYNGQTVTMVGPKIVEVGEQATFVTNLPPGVSGSWVYPDGSLQPTGNGVTYTPQSPGSFVVTLLMTAPGSGPKLLIHTAQAQ